MASCEWCGSEYSPRQVGQRFCGAACSNGWHAWIRREALKSVRETSTYYDRQEEALSPGGRFAALEPRLTDAELPAPVWAPDLLGVEPPADRREDGPRINGFPLHEEWE
jgi:hypothetical protein